MIAGYRLRIDAYDKKSNRFMKSLESGLIHDRSKEMQRL